MGKSPIQLSLDEAGWLTQNLPIRLFGDPVLTTPCEVVTDKEIESGKVKKWADELIDFLKKYRARTGAGRGLAANQIGISKRLVLIWSNDGPKIYINPEVVSSEGRGTYPESCISSASLIMGEVKRAWTITVDYISVEGKEESLKADPIQSRLLLHEIDHLDGKVCSDKYTPGTIRLTSGDSNEILRPELARIK